MTERRLRYSERKRLAETGSLGQLIGDAVPAPLRNALNEWLRSRSNLFNLPSAATTAALHFGLGRQDISFYVGNGDLGTVADALEIVMEHYVGQRRDLQEGELNALFERHRWSYRIEGGEVRRISSPVLDDEVTGPALLAVKRMGWEEVERSYAEALRHQRGGPEENDDALTAANAALEAALKAVGMNGNTLGELGRSLRRSRLVPGHLAGVPEALDTLLQRSNAIRSTAGDAHGKAPNAEAVPQALVNLAIHWTGAFLVYLAETVSADGDQSSGD